MTDERPLNVQLAEALGWTDLRREGSRYSGIPPEGDETASGYVEEPYVPPGRIRVPLFDERWSATGPLIEKYNLGLDHRRAVWAASRIEESLDLGLPWIVEFGDTPLEAVCHCLLKILKGGSE